MRDDRPELSSLSGYARRKDVLPIWRLVWLGLYLTHLLDSAGYLQDSGVDLRSLTESANTNTPVGRLISHVFGAVPEFERAISAKRTPAGVPTARAVGRHPGGPGLGGHTIAAARPLDEAGTPRTLIYRTLSISRSNVYRCWELAL